MKFCETLEYTFRGRDYVLVWGDHAWAWAWEGKGLEALDRFETNVLLDDLQLYDSIFHAQLVRALVPKVTDPFADAFQQQTRAPSLGGSGPIDLDAPNIANRLRVFFRPRQTSVGEGAQTETETESVETPTREEKGELDEIKVRIVRSDTREPLLDYDFKIFLTNGSNGEAAPDGQGWSKYSGLPAGTCYLKLLAKGWEVSPTSK